MSKRSTKTKTKTKTKAKPKHANPQPEPAQLQAIDRLLRAERYQDATERLHDLIRRFPSHGGLRRTLVETLEASGSTGAAAIAAFEWAERRPNSLPAQQVAFRHALRGTHPFLADHIAARLIALGEQVPGFPISEQDKAQLAVQSDGAPGDPAAMLQFDIGRLYLAGEDYVGTLRILEGADILASRHNRALALFQLGRIGDAEKVFDAAWRSDADNLLALGWTARLRLYRGDAHGARELCPQLADANPRRADDAISQLHALLLLDEAQAAFDAWCRAAAASWWEELDDLGTTLLSHLGACAAAAVGESDEAHRLWWAAEQARPGSTPAKQNLAALLMPEAAGGLMYPAVLTPAQALPMGAIKGLSKLVGAGDQVSVKLGGISVAYLEAVYRSGDEMLRSFARMLLTAWMQGGNTDAPAALRRFACLPIGTRKQRVDLLMALRSAGCIDADEEVEYWADDGPSCLGFSDMEVHREPRDSGLPPMLDQLFIDSLQAYGESRYADAEQGLRAILSQRPDHAATLANLATVRSALGFHDEAKTLLREALDADPDYLFARCNLAIFLVIDGDLDAAANLIESRGRASRIHIQDLIGLNTAMAAVRSARGDPDGARATLDSLKPLLDGEAEHQRLDLAYRAVERAARGALVHG